MAQEKKDGFPLAEAINVEAVKGLVDSFCDAVGVAAAAGDRD